MEEGKDATTEFRKLQAEYKAKFGTNYPTIPAIYSTPLEKINENIKRRIKENDPLIRPKHKKY